MVRVSKEKMGVIAPLFAGLEETLVWSCLQGCMGNAWADNTENPLSAQIITGDFCFFAGIPDNELIGNIPDYYTTPWMIVYALSEDWYGPIREFYGRRCSDGTRFAIKKQPVDFDRQFLSANINVLPMNFEISELDAAAYDETAKNDWSNDFCSQFKSFNDYREHGIGYVVRHKGQIVSGASSYTYYKGGIEIEIGTLKEYRRRGLALACASALILACLDRGLYPSWDASNMDSVKLAEKLGYHFSHEYHVFYIRTLR